MNLYKGIATEKPVGGGEYNKENVGFEAYNYLGYKGGYYGFVEPGEGRTIHIENLYKDKKSCHANKAAEFIKDVLVVWVANHYIVGWYRDATVYRKRQSVPEIVMSDRELKTHTEYNIYSEKVCLVPPENRNYCIEGMGRSNIWYNSPQETDESVIAYIENYEKDCEQRIEIIEDNLSGIVGKEREAVVKVRVNQDKFRTDLISKYDGHCCLCNVSHEQLLVASHIKPWSRSNAYEKIDIENGLLLCPNHDKLFDSGLITFGDDGSIQISSHLDRTNRILMNVTDDMRIDVNEINREYLRYHRENIYKE